MRIMEKPCVKAMVRITSAMIRQVVPALMPSSVHFLYTITVFLCSPLLASVLRRLRGVSLFNSTIATTAAATGIRPEFLLGRVQRLV
jgi:hypothetical protein